MVDCSIQLTHHPGDLARVAQALARCGVNATTTPRLGSSQR